MVGVDMRGADARRGGLVQHAMEAATMHAEFGHLVAGKAAARLVARLCMIPVRGAIVVNAARMPETGRRERGCRRLPSLRDPYAVRLVYSRMLRHSAPSS
jgi:hypothetical protein